MIADMTDGVDPRLDDLLLRWEELHEQGQSISADDSAPPARSWPGSSPAASTCSASSTPSSTTPRSLPDTFPARAGRQVESRVWPPLGPSSAISASTPPGRWARSSWHERRAQPRGGAEFLKPSRTATPRACAVPPGGRGHRGGWSTANVICFLASTDSFRFSRAIPWCLLAHCQHVGKFGIARGFRTQGVKVVHSLGSELVAVAVGGQQILARLYVDSRELGRRHLDLASAFLENHLVDIDDDLPRFRIPSQLLVNTPARARADVSPGTNPRYVFNSPIARSSVIDSALGISNNPGAERVKPAHCGSGRPLHPPG